MTMSNSLEIAVCAVCKVELKNLKLRNRKNFPKNIICTDCGTKMMRNCGICSVQFAPRSLRGQSFSYCKLCAREYRKQYARGKTLKSTLSELECLYCLQPFQARSMKSKCCSHDCNSSYNMYVKLTGKTYRSCDLVECRCGELVSKQSRSCVSCRSASCGVDGCDEIVKNKGLCNKHLLRLRRRGSFNPEPLPRPSRPRCAVDLCDKPEKENGLCRKHLEARDNPRAPRLCSHAGCDRKHHGKGLCSFHYSRYLNGTDLDAPKIQKKYDNPLCLHDGCNKQNEGHGYGLCKTHFKAKTRRRYKNGITWMTLGPKVNWECHLCGEEVERVPGTWETPRGANVDHLIPRSKGGLDDWDNVLLAHYSCNHSRSNADLGTKVLKKKIDEARFASLEKVFQC